MEAKAEEAKKEESKDLKKENLPNQSSFQLNPNQTINSRQQKRGEP
jgi:hypothetical protein